MLSIFTIYVLANHIATHGYVLATKDIAQGWPLHTTYELT